MSVDGFKLQFRNMQWHVIHEEAVELSAGADLFCRWFTPEPVISVSLLDSQGRFWECFFVAWGGAWVHVYADRPFVEHVLEFQPLPQDIF